MTEPRTSQHRVAQFEFDIGSLLRILRRRHRIIGLIALLAVVVAMVQGLRQADLYESAVILAITDPRRELAIPELLADLPQRPKAEVEKVLIASRTVAEAVVDRLGLVHRFRWRAPASARTVTVTTLLTPEPTRPVRYRIRWATGRWRLLDPDGRTVLSGRVGETTTTDAYAAGMSTALEQGEVVVDRVPRRAAVASLRKRLSVRLVGRTRSVLRVAVRDTNPELAARIANTVAAVYVERNIDELGREAEQTMRFIERQLAAIRASLERGERELDRVKQEHGVFLLAEEARGIIDKLAELEVAKAEVAMRDRQLAAAEKALVEGERPFFVSGDDPLFAELSQELASAMARLETLRTRYTDRHPDVVTQRARIKALRQRLLAAVRDARTLLRARLESLEQTITRYDARLRAMPETERRLAILTRSTTVNAELYTFLLRAYEEARIRRAGIVGNVRIIDPAIPGTEPVAPRRGLLLVLALLVGLLVGVALAVVVDLQLDPVEDPDTIEAETKVAVVATLPALGRRRRERSYVHDAFVEAVHVLRNHVEFTAGQVRPWRVMFTSSYSGEGKTTVLVALAEALIEVGHRVLVIDADLRWPRLHERFGVPTGPGLSELLRRDSDLTDYVREVRPNLDVLTAGEAIHTPAQLLASPRMQRLLSAEIVAARYEFVLIDTPAAALFGDALALGSLCEAVYVVLQPGFSRKRALRRLLAQTEQLGVHVRGFVFNRVRRGSGTYGYGYGYGYGGYGRTEAAYRSRWRRRIEHWRARALQWLLGD